MPKENPILMSGGMVRSIIEGEKTQTRRLVEHVLGIGRVTDFGTSNTKGYNWTFRDKLYLRCHDLRHDGLMRRCPYGQKGDRLWVREKWAAPHRFDHLPPKLIPINTSYHYAATETLDGLLWRPSIHMPRWASRITLEITDVRVERLQDIGEANAKAEGAVDWFLDLNGSQQCDAFCNASVPLDAAKQEPSAHDCFIMLWDSLNFKRAPWKSNPWVWMVEFRPAN